MSYKTRPDEDDGSGQLLPLYREYTLSRATSQSRACAASPEEQLLDQSLNEVQIVKILGQYGLEIAIPSPNDRERTSYVMIS